MPTRRLPEANAEIRDGAVDAYRDFVRLREDNRTAEERALAETEDALFEAFQHGASVSDMADAMGVHRQRVYQMLDEAHFRSIMRRAEESGEDSLQLAKREEATKRVLDKVKEVRREARAGNGRA